MPKNKLSQTPKSTPPPAVRDEDFFSRYANNIRFEATVYDLRLLFGEVDQENSKETIHQHTAISIPWPVVKLLSYFLQIGMLFHEAQNGKIVIPPSQLPQPFEPATGEMANNPAFVQALERAKKLREGFLSDL